MIAISPALPARCAETRAQLKLDFPILSDVGNAYANVAQRLLRYTDRRGLRHYVDGMRNYFLGCVMESTKRNQRMAHVADYSVVRLRCSAVYPTLDIGAIVEGIEVPDAVREEPAFEVMRQATNLCVSYVNDVFSYAKESSAGETSNLVIIYEQAGMDLRDSMQAAMVTSDRVVEEYFEAKAYLEAELEDELDQATRDYIKVMQDWMRGNFDWYNDLRTDRYTDFLTTAVPA